MDMKKRTGVIIVGVCVAAALGFWVHGRLTDPVRRLRVTLGRDVVQWYFDTLSIRQSGFHSLRPESDRTRRECDRKETWGIPSEVSLFDEETEFRDISDDELLFRYTATFFYPGRQEGVTVTETYFADAWSFLSPPFPLKREIFDTKADPKKRTVFVWNGGFNRYLEERFGCKIVEQSPGAYSSMAADGHTGSGQE